MLSLLFLKTVGLQLQMKSLKPLRLLLITLFISSWQSYRTNFLRHLLEPFFTPQISKVFTPLAETNFEGSHIPGQAKDSSDKIRQNPNKNC